MSTKLFYSFLKWVAIGPILRAIFRPTYEGADNIPRKGQAIMASNHLSYADWLFMPLGMRRMVRFVAKAEYFTGTGLKGSLQRIFFSGTGNVPIDRGGATAAEGALIAAKRVLGEGELFGIYPEGTRSHDGKLYRGRTGVARLALDTGAPVVPVAVIGTDLIAPPGKKFGRIVQPRIVYGKPLDFSRYDGMANDRYILRAITDEIVYEILKLSGQEYVDMYATEAKKLADGAKASKKSSKKASKRSPTKDVA